MNSSCPRSTVLQMQILLCCRWDSLGIYVTGLPLFVLLSDEEEGRGGDKRDHLDRWVSQLTQYRGRSGVGEFRLKWMTLWVCIFLGLARWIDGKKHNIWTNKDEEVECDQNPQQALAAGAAAGARQGWWPVRWRSNGRGGVVGGT